MYTRVLFTMEQWNAPERSSWTRWWTPKQRACPNFRKVQELIGGTSFDYKSMSDENIDDFWYIGVPDVQFPRAEYHRARSFAMNVFDRSGSFVKQEMMRRSRAGLPPRPPSLLHLAADKLRRQECIELATAWITNAQRKHGPWTNGGSSPDLDALLAVINETLLDFLERIGPSIIGMTMANLSVSKLNKNL